MEPARQAQCIAAAELLELAETARQAAHSDSSHRNIEMAVRADGAARRALEALGIEKPSPGADDADQGYGLFVDDDDEG